MQLLRDPISILRTVLDDLGFEQLQALPAVPVNNPRHLRYPFAVTTSADDERWYLRSYGVDFDLVGPSRRDAARRWYSVGWGWCDGREVRALLLAQAELAEARPDEVLEPIRARTEGRPFASSVTADRHGHQLRLCMVLDPAPADRGF